MSLSYGYFEFGFQDDNLKWALTSWMSCTRFYFFAWIFYSLITSILRQTFASRRNSRQNSKLLKFCLKAIIGNSITDCNFYFAILVAYLFEDFQSIMILIIWPNHAILLSTCKTCEGYFYGGTSMQKSMFSFIFMSNFLKIWFYLDVFHLFLFVHYSFNF